MGLQEQLLGINFQMIQRLNHFVSSMPTQTLFEAFKTFYVSVDQARLRDRFPGVPETFSNTTLRILPYSLTTQITCLPKGKFSIKIT